MRRMRSQRRSWLLTISLMSAITLCHAQSSDEYTLKAALNYNFAKFAQWPVVSDGSPIELCYFNGQYQSSFEPLMGRTVGSRVIRIRKVGETDRLGSCNLVFIDADYRRLLDKLFQQIDDRPILTVADFMGFTEQGGMIEIHPVDNKLRFKINLQELQKSGLSMSSQVLILASEVVK